MIMAWAVTSAARRGSVGQVLKTLGQMRKVYDDLAKIRAPGRRSIWEGTPEERAQRFAASAATASTELLEACAAELRYRAAR